MENSDQDINLSATHAKYNTLVSIITGTESRLRTSDLFYLSLNILIFLFIASHITFLTSKVGYYLTYVDLALIFLSIVIGLSINTFWIAFAMRLQLRLKLKYFQARTLERKMNSAGEYIFSDEHIFFEPTIYRLESFDKKETIFYPTSGPTRMDGFVGSAKPRVFSWLFPFLFIGIYWTIFFLVLTVI